MYRYGVCIVQVRAISQTKNARARTELIFAVHVCLSLRDVADWANTVFVIKAARAMTKIKLNTSHAVDVHNRKYLFAWMIDLSTPEFFFVGKT